MADEETKNLDNWVKPQKCLNYLIEGEGGGGHSFLNGERHNMLIPYGENNMWVEC